MFLASSSPTAIYTLSLHDALPIWFIRCSGGTGRIGPGSDLRLVLVVLEEFFLGDGLVGDLRLADDHVHNRSEEHTSELQSHVNLVCRLLLEKKNNNVFCGNLRTVY